MKRKLCVIIMVDQADEAAEDNDQICAGTESF